MMKGKQRTAVVALGAVAVLGGMLNQPARGDESASGREALDQTIQELNQEINTLKERDNQQVRALNTLLDRLKTLESQRQQAPEPPQSTQRPATEPSTNSAAPPDREKPRQQSVDDLVGEEFGLFSRRLTIESGFNYSHSDRQKVAMNGFLALDAIFLGRLSVDEVRNDIVTWTTAMRYGITDNLQLDIQVPYLFRETLYRSGGAEGSSTRIVEETVSRSPELGDVSAGLNYNLIREAPGHPGLSWSMRVKAPTGDSPYGVDVIDVAGAEGNLSVPRKLPTGNGVWAVSTSLSVLKTVNPAVLFAHLGVTRNVEEDFDDISGEPDSESPGDIKLGDALQFGVGLGYALNERISLTVSYSQQLQRKSRIRREGEDWQTIIASEANSATFNNTVTVALDQHWSMVSTLGMGLTEDASDMNFGLKMSYSF